MSSSLRWHEFKADAKKMQPSSPTLHRDKLQEMQKVISSSCLHDSDKNNFSLNLSLYQYIASHSGHSLEGFQFTVRAPQSIRKPSNS